MHKTFSETIAARLNEVRAASTSGGGTALTTTAGLISIPFSTNLLTLTAHKFVGADVVKYAINPFLTVIYTTDALAEAGHASDISKEAQDGDATDNNFLAWDVLDNGCALYVGAHVPFRGCAVDIGTTPNDIASVLTIKYWDGDSWVDTANSEGTKVVGDCLKQDGNETWTPSATWASESLHGAGETDLLEPWARLPLYWTRWEVSVLMTANMDIAQIRALNRESTQYAELIEGQPVEMMLKADGSGGHCTIEALTDAGTAKLIANVATTLGESF